MAPCLAAPAKQAIRSTGLREQQREQCMMHALRHRINTCPASRQTAAPLLPQNRTCQRAVAAAAIAAARVLIRWSTAWQGFGLAEHHHDAASHQTPCLAR